MSHPTPGKGTFIKLRGILDIANRDQKWASELKRDPRGTIQRAGLDLSDQELEAVADIVNNTSNSTYANNPPPTSVDKFPELRDVWKNTRIAP